MKQNSFFAHAGLWFALCVGFILASCEKPPKLDISPMNVTCEAFPEEPIDIEITTTVNWEVTVRPGDDWLLVSPKQGKGNGTITIEVDENHEFTERIARIAISGEGVKTDTIRIYQAPDVDIKAYIKDETFRDYCLKNFDNDPSDEKISMKEARKVNEINVRRMQISNLAGIEYFSKIKYIYCSENDIESIDVSNNKDLINLDCSKNSIKSLDVSGNTALRILKCSDNPITYVNVDGLQNLTDLDINSAKLTDIDVSSNTNLEWLIIENNQIAKIDVSHNPELTQLTCGENGLTELVLSNNTKLVILYCGNNKINSLNLDNNKALEHFYCNNNQLTGINLSNNSVLKEFNCSNNSFSSLNLSNCSNLEGLYCSNNQLATLTLNNNLKLKQLHCDANQFTTLVLSNNTALEGLRCTYNKLQNSIDISKNTLLTYIELQNNPNLKTINVWPGFFENLSKPNSYTYRKDEAAEWKVP